MNKTHSYIVFLLFCLSMLISTVGTADRTYGPVKNKDYLSKIVNKSYPNSALTRDQLMVGILRANHDSFRGGNVHFLKVGENLTLPDEDVISLIDKDEATRTVKEHLTFFKRGRPGSFPALPLPKVVAPESPETAVDEKADADEDSTKEDVSSDEKSGSIEADKLEPVQESVANAAKETEESRTKLESLESEKTQQDEVLQSLEMQIKKLEDELESTASDEKKAEENVASTDEDAEKEESEPSSSASNKDSLEESTISALENNLSSNTEDELVVPAEAEETPKAEVVESIESSPKESVAEETKSTAAEEKVFVEEKKKEEEPKAVSKEVVDTPVTESAPVDSNIPWWVWVIPLFLVPLLILGLIFKSKNRVSSTDLPNIKKPKKKTAVKELPHVNASEPVIKTSSTVVESGDGYEETVPQDANGVVSASEQEVPLKIDMARAYLDMDYHDAAVEILNEVVAEGNTVQVERAREILARI